MWLHRPYGQKFRFPCNLAKNRRQVSHTLFSPSLNSIIFGICESWEIYLGTHKAVVHVHGGLWLWLASGWVRWMSETSSPFTYFMHILKLVINCKLIIFLICEARMLIHRWWLYACVCVCVVWSIFNKLTPSSHKLFPVRHDDNYACLCHSARPSDQNENDSGIGMYGENWEYVINFVIYSAVHLHFAIFCEGIWVYKQIKEKSYVQNTTNAVRIIHCEAKNCTLFIFSLTLSNRILFW